MEDIKICSNCKKSISEKDVKAGTVYQQGTKIICLGCARELGAVKDGVDEHVYILQSTLDNVRDIKRALTYEKSTWVNIAGAVVQCLVFGVLIFACVSNKENTVSVLLLALVFQVMALNLLCCKEIVLLYKNFFIQIFIVFMKYRSLYSAFWLRLHRIIYLVFLTFLHQKY